MTQVLTVSFPDGRKVEHYFRDRLAAESDAAYWRKIGATVVLTTERDCPFCGDINRAGHSCN